MSFINGSPLMGTAPAFDYDRPQNEATQTASYASSQYGDGFGRSPIALPIQSRIVTPAYVEDGSASEGAPGAASTSESAFFTSIMNSLSNLMQQISSYFGGSAGTATTTGTPIAAAPENMFSNATASSLGDPHDTFGGTTTRGATLGDKWDSMQAHADLLDSDSFRGGYDVATTATAPSASGVTYNASATVTTHGGKTSVTMNRDGSYAVTSDGQNVTLAQGEATQLGRGETVTLNADASLTIVDTNRQGGSITTSLSDNGHGVDVKASASNVDLGGYLVDKSDRDAEPVALRPGAGSVATYQNYAADSEPLGPGELEFA